MTLDLKASWRIGMVFLAVSILAGAAGCGKDKTETITKKQPQSRWDAELDAEVRNAKEATLKDIMHELELTKTPYQKGKLTPELAAEITHQVGRRSLHEVPIEKEFPNDPKEIMALNKRIRERTGKIYAGYGTTQGNVMRYISDMSDAERESYDKKLTELFLEISRKKYGEKKTKSSGAASKSTPQKK